MAEGCGSPSIPKRRVVTDLLGLQAKASFPLPRADHMSALASVDDLPSQDYNISLRLPRHPNTPRKRVGEYHLHLELKN